MILADARASGERRYLLPLFVSKERDQFEIIAIVDTHCSTATQVGEPPLVSIWLDNGGSKNITINETVYEIHLTYLKNEGEIQGVFIVK
jgi:hypothetical protein